MAFYTVLKITKITYPILEATSESFRFAGART